MGTPPAAAAPSALPQPVSGSWKGALQLGLLLLTGLAAGRAGVTLYFFRRFVWGDEGWELLAVIPLLQFQLLSLWLPAFRGRLPSDPTRPRPRWSTALRILVPFLLVPGFFLPNRWLALAGCGTVAFLAIGDPGERIRPRLGLTLASLVSVPVLLEAFHGGRLGPAFGRLLLLLVAAYTALMVPWPARTGSPERGRSTSLIRSRLWILLLLGYLAGAAGISWISFGRVDLRPGTILQWLVIPALQAFLVGMTFFPIPSNSWWLPQGRWEQLWISLNLFLMLVWIGLPGWWPVWGGFQLLGLGVWGATRAAGARKLLASGSDRRLLLSLAILFLAGPLAGWLDLAGRLSSLPGIAFNRWLLRVLMVTFLLTLLGLLLILASRSLGLLFEELRTLLDLAVLPILAACQVGWIRTYWGGASPPWTAPVQGSLWILSMMLLILGLGALRGRLRNEGPGPRQQ